MKKHLISFLAATLALLAVPVGASPSLEVLPVGGVFYAGTPTQVCLRLKVTAKQGESLCSLQFSTADCTRLSDLSGVHLYSSKQAPFFSPHSSDASLRADRLASSNTAAAGTVYFNTTVNLKEGDNYLWLVYDLASTARGNDLITAQCLSVTDGTGKLVQPSNNAPPSAAKVFPFKYRIAPYYRPKWITTGWDGGLLNATHFKYLTDFIFFGYSTSDTSIVAQGDSGEEVNPVALEKVKKWRGRSAANIILGLKNGNNIEAVMANSAQREELANNLVACVKENGFQGVNIDWEYPKTAANWRNLAYFLAILREKLAGTGTTLSLAIDVNYDPPPAEVWDQADYLCMMTYDRPGQHSTMNHARSDISKVRGWGVPNPRIILGLPFYSNETRASRNWNEQKGYNYILRNFPTLSANVNTFRDPKSGEEHYFNGATLIKQKCKYAIQQKIGGVMIWCYDNDAPLTNPRSLSKAMYSVIKQAKR